jgi:hypothetical protein
MGQFEPFDRLGGRTILAHCRCRPAETATLLGRPVLGWSVGAAFSYRMGIPQQGDRRDAEIRLIWFDHRDIRRYERRV